MKQSSFRCHSMFFVEELLSILQYIHTYIHAVILPLRYRVAVLHQGHALGTLPLSSQRQRGQFQSVSSNIAGNYRTPAYIFSRHYYRAPADEYADSRQQSESSKLMDKILRLGFVRQASPLRHGRLDYYNRRPPHSGVHSPLLLAAPTPPAALLTCLLFFRPRQNFCSFFVRWCPGCATLRYPRSWSTDWRLSPTATLATGAYRSTVSRGIAVLLPSSSRARQCPVSPAWFCRGMRYRAEILVFFCRIF